MVLIAFCVGSVASMAHCYVGLHVLVAYCTVLVNCLRGFAENWSELVQKIKSKGMRPAVALKPGTPIEEVFPLV